MKPKQTYSQRYPLAGNLAYCLGCTARRHFPLLCWCGLAVLIQVALPLLTAWMPKAVIEGISGGDWPGLARTILLFAGGIAALSGVERFFTQFIYWTKFRMNACYVQMVAKKGLATDYRNQEDSVFRQLQEESYSCCNGNFSPLTRIYDLLIGLCTGLLGLAVYWAVLSRLHFAVVLFLIAAAAASYFVNRSAIRWTEAHNPERVAFRQRLSYINEVSGDLRSAKDIRLYNMAQWFSQLYEGNMEGLAGWYRQLKQKLFRVEICDGGLSLLREGAAYGYLLYLVWQGELTAADFILYFGIIAGFSTWLSGILAQLAQLNGVSLKISSFRAFLDYPEHFCREGGIAPPQGAPASIRLKKVSYRYQGAEEYTLKNLSLTINPGEHLAIVGLNGAGKTTLVKLICGLIDPTEGRILYDGRDVREYNRLEFYRQFSAVFQQFSLLPVTVEEIVAEAPTEGLDRAKVMDALKTAGLWEKIQSLPKGLSANYGKAIFDDGVELSGGEVQKLLLARALYRSAPNLLLDEPTAALDPIAESQLYERYSGLSQGKTAIFISHRLASTAFCDRIILMEDGAVAEEGSHQSLLAARGKYYSLFEIQAKYYREHPAGEEETQ